MTKACALRVTLGILAALLVVSCTQSEVSDPAETAKGKLRKASVVVERLERTPFSVEQSFSGEVWAVADASLTVGEAGRVKRVYVAEGDRVAAGQLLLELETGLALAELGQAQAAQQRIAVQHGQANVEAERFAVLQKQELVSDRESQLENSRALALRADETGAQATVQLMSQRVQQHRILAPFAGTVARRRVDPGDWLSPGQFALELLTESQVEVQVRVPPWLLEQDISGSSARLQSGSRSTPALVTRSVPALDRQTRTALVRLRPVERPTWLLAGTDVQVIFSIEHKQGFSVPRDALVYGLSGVRVVRVVAGKAEPINVQVLETSGKRALVESNTLQWGDTLVVRGNERLRPGQGVNVQGAISGHSSSGEANR